jgi:long-chain acyl-CoA synthetase
VREFSVPASFTVGEHDTVVSSVFSHEADDPDHVIIQRLLDGSWTDVTCAQVASQVRSAALGLIAEGVQPGDRVAILSATRYEWPIVDFAILSIGAVTVPIYETSSAEQIKFVLSNSGAVAAFAETDEHANKIEQLKGDLPELRKVLRIDGTGPTALDELAEAGKGVDPTEVQSRLAAIKSADVATLVYTSGTTGQPKGCQLTHSNLLHEMRGAKASFPALLDKGEKLLVFLPLAHVLARAITICAFSNKVTLGFTSDVKNLVPTLAVFKPTLVVSVPRVFEKVYNTAEQNAHDGGKDKIFAMAANTAIEWSQAQDKGGPGLLLNLKHTLFDRLVYGKLRAALGGKAQWAISGGAALAPRLGHFFRGIGVSILEGYGLTETTAPVSVNRPERQKIGSVGQPLPGVAVRIADDGEVLVSGKSIFPGYWRDEGATKEAFVDGGWYATGDLGELDDEGFLSITGRKKEIIVTAGGKNVSPAVLEDRLRMHGLISQCMVVGDGRPFVGVLITLDEETFGPWKARHGKPADATASDLRDDPDLNAEIQAAVDDANKAVSRAESIRKFRLLDGDFTQEQGHLSAKLGIKRSVLAKEFAGDIEALYAKN